MNRRDLMKAIVAVPAVVAGPAVASDRIVIRGGEKAARYARVWLDGVHITYITAYADTAGVVVVNEQTETGNARWWSERNKPMGFAQHTLRGDVRVELDVPDEAIDVKAEKVRMWKQLLASGRVEPRVTALLNGRGILGTPFSHCG